MTGRAPVPFAGLVRAEWRKARGRGLGLIVLGFGLFHGLLASFGLFGLLELQRQAVESMDDPVDLLVGADLAINLAVFPVNGLALLLLASLVWAEDFSLGTLAMILTRPVARWRVFLAKFVLLLLVTFASLGLALVGAVLPGVLLFGTSGDTTLLAGAPVVGWMADCPSFALRAVRIGAGLLAGTAMLAPPLALAALVAMLVRSPVLTLFGTTVLLTVDFFLTTVLSVWGKADLSSSPTAAWLSELTLWSGRDFFALHGPGTILSEGLGALVGGLAYTGLFLTIALFLFCRRDVT